MLVTFYLLNNTFSLSVIDLSLSIHSEKQQLRYAVQCNRQRGKKK